MPTVWPDAWSASPGFRPAATTKEKPMLRKLILAAALGGMTLAAAACNTVKGLGNDVESVGEAGDEAIR
jgi:entericidin B